MNRYLNLFKEIVNKYVTSGDVEPIVAESMLSDMDSELESTTLNKVTKSVTVRAMITPDMSVCSIVLLSNNNSPLTARQISDAVIDYMEVFEYNVEKEESKEQGN